MYLPGVNQKRHWILPCKKTRKTVPKKCSTLIPKVQHRCTVGIPMLHYPESYCPWLDSHLHPDVITFIFIPSPSPRPPHFYPHTLTFTLTPSHLPSHPHTYPHTLTLTLTTETPINRAFQAICEGVRVRKEKLFLLKYSVNWDFTITYNHIINIDRTQCQTRHQIKTNG